MGLKSLMEKDKISVLVVDDEPNMRDLFKRILKEKYDTVVVGKGKDAIREAKRKFYNVVFLDIILPDLNGLDVLKAVREINEDKEIF